MTHVAALGTGQLMSRQMLPSSSIHAVLVAVAPTYVNILSASWSSFTPVGSGRLRYSGIHWR